MIKKINFYYGIIFGISLTALIVACLSYTKSLPIVLPSETLENGEACFLNTQCDSGYCSGTTVIAGEPVEGECKPKKKDGASCESGTECVNGKCNNCCAHGKYSSKYCCPGGKTKDTHPFGIKTTWCEKTPKGKSGCVGGSIC